MKCSGSESALDKCSFTWATEGECNHTADVVVECYGGNATGQPATPAECEVSELQELLTLTREELEKQRDDHEKQLSSEFGGYFVLRTVRYVYLFYSN